MSKEEMDAQEYEQGISTRTLEECELVSWYDRSYDDSQTDRQTDSPPRKVGSRQVSAALRFLACVYSSTL